MYIIFNLENKRMEELFRNSRYKSILATFCAFGWSLAYPLIKVGYKEFQIG